MKTVAITAAVSADMGRVRKNNEDNYYFDGVFLTEQTREQSSQYVKRVADNVTHIFGVFDGMGGEAFGEVASYITAQEVHKQHLLLTEGGDGVNALLKAIENANCGICEKMIECGEGHIGTTFAAIVVQDGTVRCVNVGDSRVYMMRGGVLTQISVDDTATQRLVKLGIITPEEAKTHKDRNRLVQHLGIFKNEMTIQPHVTEPIEPQKGDMFLICSDGLTDMVPDEQIASIIKAAKAPQEASAMLLKAALEAGGRDNTTVMLVGVGAGKAVGAGARKAAGAGAGRGAGANAGSLKRFIPILAGVAGAAVVALVVVLLSHSCGKKDGNGLVPTWTPDGGTNVQTDAAYTDGTTEDGTTETGTEEGSEDVVDGERVTQADMDEKDPKKEDWRKHESDTETYEELYIDGKPTGKKRNVKKKPPKTTETKEDKIEWKPVETETETYEEKYVNGVATGEKRNVKKKTVEETPGEGHEEVLPEWRQIEKKIDENHSETFEAEYVNGVATGNTRNRHTIEWKLYEDDNESYEEKYEDGSKTGEKRKEKKYTWKAGESETETFEEQYHNGVKTGKKRNVKAKAPVEPQEEAFDDFIVSEKKVYSNVFGEETIEYYNQAGQLVKTRKKTIDYTFHEYVVTDYDRFGNVTRSVNMGIVPQEVMAKIQASHH